MTVECPYCEKEQTIDHDDGYGFQENETYTQECSDCAKTFTYTTSITYDHEAEKAPCQNGTDHKWAYTRTIPRIMTRQRCAWCGAEKELSPEELKTYLESIGEKITSKEQYIKELLHGR